MKQKINQFAAFAGIDWADQKHDVSVSANGSSSSVHRVIKNTPEDLGDWVAQLRQQYPEGKIAVCLEQSKGALIFHLLQYDFLTLFPINPKKLSKYRESFTASGAKGDSTDAELIRQYVAEHNNLLRPWEPDDEPTGTISFLVYGRRKAVDERTRLTNRLSSTLKMYFPQALKLIGETLYSSMALDFLTKWPQLQNVQRAGKKTIQMFYSTHNSRSKKLTKQRLSFLCPTTPLTKDQAVIKSCLLTVKMLVAQITQINSAVAEFETELKELYDDHPDQGIFNSFPGSGEALSPRLLSAWGSDRSRYDSSDSMQKYSGTAPITKASGKSKIVIRRLACPKFLLQTFHEYANCSRQFSVWAQAFYEMKREHGKSHHMAVRSLAYKWIRIMFRCWKNRTKYDETKYIKTLQKSKAPLLKFILN
jgi:transposase